MRPRGGRRARPARGVWVYEASGAGTASMSDDVLTLRHVKTATAARDGTDYLVVFTHVIRARAAGGQRSVSGSHGVHWRGGQ